jgi:hypothetical protein
MQKKLLLLVLMFLPFIASAYEEPPSFYYTEVDGFYYTFDDSNNTATMTCKARIAEKVAIDTWRNVILTGDYSGSVEIPSEVTYNKKNYKVTSVDKSAFYQCTGLISIIIPSSITSIGSSVFSGCSNLTTVNILGGVTSIGDYAFNGCSSLSTIELPNSLTSIGYSAFSGCTSLTSITIPENVTSIASYVFQNCSCLTTINIPQSITSIGNDVFKGTIWYEVQPDGLMYLDNYLLGYKGEKPTGTITINEGTTLLADQAFYMCNDLTSVTFPNSLKYIGSSTFQKTSLTSVTFPNSLKYIGYSAFSGCSSLIEVVALPETPPTISTSSFPYDNNTKMFDSKIKLLIIEAAQNAYLSTSPWNLFPTIEMLGVGVVDKLKCATPIISFQNGQLTFTCDTEGVTYNYTITCPSSATGTNNSGCVSLGSDITVSVFASKPGYKNSDKATKAINVGIKGDVDGNGVVDVADHVDLSKIIMGQE